jgi:hypothetical protein
MDKVSIGLRKKKKRQRLEAAAQSQKGALDRFVMKESRINSENQTLDANVDDGRGDNVEEIEDIAELDERNDDSLYYIKWLEVMDAWQYVCHRCPSLPRAYA